MRAKEYVQTLSRFFVDNPAGKAYYEWVLSKGEEFEQDPCSPKCRDIMHEVCSGERFKVKECYYNAWRLAAAGKRNGVRYYEGWGSGIIPTEHAWAVADGTVLDPTWKKIMGRETISYFGIELPIQWVTKMTVKKKMVEPMLFLYWKEKVGKL